jgi:hypothetical protein
MLCNTTAGAAVPDWSAGGWPDQFGAEVMGMSCGPTPDWDHDLGCPEGFGGFKAYCSFSTHFRSRMQLLVHACSWCWLQASIRATYKHASPASSSRTTIDFSLYFFLTTPTQGYAFVSCTGPFDGMACCFDDGTRFVAGMVATPLIQYYDATLDRTFLDSTLLPYLRGVADFYTSYAVQDKATGKYNLPWTCVRSSLRLPP